MTKGNDISCELPPLSSLSPCSCPLSSYDGFIRLPAAECSTTAPTAGSQEAAKTVETYGSTFAPLHLSASTPRAETEKQPAQSNERSLFSASSMRLVNTGHGVVHVSCARPHHICERWVLMKVCSMFHRDHLRGGEMLLSA